MDISKISPAFAIINRFFVFYDLHHRHHYHRRHRRRRHHHRHHYRPHPD